MDSSDKFTVGNLLPCPHGPCPDRGPRPRCSTCAAVAGERPVRQHAGRAGLAARWRSNPGQLRTRVGSGRLPRSRPGPGRRGHAVDRRIHPYDARRPPRQPSRLGADRLDDRRTRRRHRDRERRRPIPAGRHRHGRPGRTQTRATVATAFIEKVDTTHFGSATQLGAMGLTTGLTAYVGMKFVGRVTESDTVVVSGAAGAVGTFAGQIARLLGATRRDRHRWWSREGSLPRRRTRLPRVDRLPRR